MTFVVTLGAAVGFGLLVFFAIILATVILIDRWKK